MKSFKVISNSKWQTEGHLSSRAATPESPTVPCDSEKCSSASLVAISDWKLPVAFLLAFMLAPVTLLAGDDWKSLFDGKTLDGWTVRGGSATYHVEDGAIVGQTTEGSPNTFLCRGPYDNFELELDVLCDRPLNSGIQIRSHVYKKETPQESNPKRIRKPGEVYGYQCEITAAEVGTAGNFWDEGRRTRWLDDFSDTPKAKTAYKNGEWNHYRIVARGDHIQSWVNGIPCADFHDDTDASGFIGLQVHGIKKGTGPYEVRWKNIRIRELDDETNQTKAQQ